jgi:arylsulfatase A-like enzyme
MSKPKSNILCFITDDQPPNWFNCSSQGKDKEGKPLSLTPTLDQLAASGTVVDQLHTPSPLCVPSRFAYLTGNYPSRARNDWFNRLHQLHDHTFIHQESKITAEDTTIAQRLKALGYRTGAIGKNHAIEVPDWKMLSRDADPANPAIREKIERNRDCVQQAYYKAGFDFAERIYHTNPSVFPEKVGVHNMEWLVEGACDFITQPSEEPFFLFFASTLPHGPREGWKHDPLATPDGLLQEPPNTTMPDRSTIPERLKAAGYDEYENRGDLLWLDDGLQSILETLKANGQLENTLIYFGTDHGIDAKASAYEPGVHITGIFSGLDVIRNETSSAPCVIPDISATLLDYAGDDNPAPEIDGRSLRPVLNGSTDRIRDSIYLEFGHTRTVIQDGWKYIALRYSDYAKEMPLEKRQAWLDAAEDYLKKCHEPFTFKTNDPEGPFGHSGYIPDGWSHERVAMQHYPRYYDPDQLYYLPDDPGEMSNLAELPEHQERLEKMKALLKKHLEPLPGGFAEFKEGLYADLHTDKRNAIGDDLMQVVFH